jgi:hypothetical protein
MTMDSTPVLPPHRARRLLRAAALVCAALAGTAALAHDDHGKPQHGGIVAEAGTFQGELVAGPKGPTLYVTDHGQPVPTAGASGKLVVLAGGQRSDLALSPAGDNRLAPAQPLPLPKGARAVATVTLKDGRSGALRFDVK